LIQVCTELKDLTAESKCTFQIAARRWKGIRSVCSQTTELFKCLCYFHS